MIEVARDLAAAEDRLGRARQLLSSIRSVSIGRLVLGFTQQSRLDPVRNRLHDQVSAYDLVTVTHEAQVFESGVRVDQVLTIQGSIRIVAETRFYSNDFYRSAIAKGIA